MSVFDDYPGKGRLCQPRAKPGIRFTIVFYWVYNITRGSFLLAALFHMVSYVADRIIPTVGWAAEAGSVRPFMIMEVLVSNFHFWQKWLFVVGLVLTVFGMALALFNQTPLFNFLFNGQINPVFWPARMMALDITRFQGWVYGVLGATISGWGVCVAFLAHYPFRNKERWAWNAIALGITVWFFIDTSISLYFRVVFNAVFNTIVFVALWLPLAITRTHMG